MRHCALDPIRAGLLSTCYYRFEACRFALLTLLSIINLCDMNTDLYGFIRGYTSQKCLCWIFPLAPWPPLPFEDNAKGRVGQPLRATIMWFTFRPVMSCLPIRAPVARLVTNSRMFPRTMAQGHASTSHDSVYLRRNYTCQGVHSMSSGIPMDHWIS